MTTNPIFGAATVGSNLIECRTRDGRTHEFPGPPNMPNGDHRASMRFSVGEGVWLVTFRKYENSPVFGEIAAIKQGISP